MPLADRCPLISPKALEVQMIIKGLWFQKLYLVWFLGPESLNGQHMKPLGNYQQAPGCVVWAGIEFLSARAQLLETQNSESF